MATPGQCNRHALHLPCHDAPCSQIKLVGKICGRGFGRSRPSRTEPVRNSPWVIGTGHAPFDFSQCFYRPGSDCGHVNPLVLRFPNHESGSDHRMLPVRWILPIVGALFALALAPLAFSPQDSARNTSVASVERPEPRQTIVPAGVQLKDPAGMHNDDDLKISPNLDVGDVTSSIQPATPLRAEPVITSPSKRVKLVQRRSRKLVHQGAKQAPVANFFGAQQAQQARRTAKPDMKFNAVY